MNTWQPIETAPKDGSKVLLYGRPWNDAGIGQYHVRDRYWMALNLMPFHSKPTHWMPLPELPSNESLNVPEQNDEKFLSKIRSLEKKLKELTERVGTIEYDLEKQSEYRQEMSNRDY